MIENKKYLKDRIANIILNDKDCRQFVTKLISKATGLDEKFLNENLELSSTRINASTDKILSNSIVDAMYESEGIFINLEVNYQKSKVTQNKNIKYVTHLVLKQIPPNIKIKEIKSVYQINLNGYDFFKDGKFIYKSRLMEETSHKIRDEFLTIIDINLDYLKKIEYTTIRDRNSLEYLLYFFVHEKDEELIELYNKDDIMKKVCDKLMALSEDFDKDLYYDLDEYLEAIAYEKGIEQGIEQGILNTAKNMIKEGIEIEIICKVTKLSPKEIEKLQKEQN